MAVNLDTALINLAINIIINVIVLSPVFWISGRLLAGKDHAKFTDALWIVIIGTVIGSIFGFFFTGIIATIIMLIIWLGLVKHFFDCGWLKALVIAIVAIIIFALIAVILGLIGFALITWIQI